MKMIPNPAIVAWKMSHCKSRIEICLQVSDVAGSLERTFLSPAHRQAAVKVDPPVSMFQS